MYAFAQSKDGTIARCGVKFNRSISYSGEWRAFPLPIWRQAITIRLRDHPSGEPARLRRIARHPLRHDAAGRAGRYEATGCLEIAAAEPQGSAGSGGPQ